MRRKDLIPEEARIGRLIQSLEQPTAAPDAEFLKRLRELSTSAFLDAHRLNSPQRVNHEPTSSETIGIGHVESHLSESIDHPTPTNGESLFSDSSTEQLASEKPATASSSSCATTSRLFQATDLGRQRIGHIRVTMALVTAILLAVGFLPDSLVPSRGARLQVAFDNLARATSAEIEVRNGDQSSTLLVAHNDNAWFVKHQFPSGNAEVTDGNGTYFFNSRNRTVHVMPPGEVDEDIRPVEKLLDNLNVADNSVRYSLLRQRPRAKVVRNGQSQWRYEFQQVSPLNGNTVSVNASVDARTNELLSINSVLWDGNGEVSFRGEANIVALNQDIAEERFRVAPDEQQLIVANVAFVESIQGNPSVDESRLLAWSDNNQPVTKFGNLGSLARNGMLGGFGGGTGSTNDLLFQNSPNLDVVNSPYLESMPEKQTKELSEEHVAEATQNANQSLSQAADDAMPSPPAATPLEVPAKSAERIAPKVATGSILKDPGKFEEQSAEALEKPLVFDLRNYVASFFQDRLEVVPQIAERKKILEPVTNQEPGAAPAEKSPEGQKLAMNDKAPKQETEFVKPRGMATRSALTPAPPASKEVAKSDVAPKSKASKIPQAGPADPSLIGRNSAKQSAATPGTFPPAPLEESAGTKTETKILNRTAGMDVPPKPADRQMRSSPDQSNSPDNSKSGKRFVGSGDTKPGYSIADKADSETADSKHQLSPKVLLPKEMAGGRGRRISQVPAPEVPVPDAPSRPADQPLAPKDLPIASKSMSLGGARLSGRPADSLSTQPAPARAVAPAPETPADTEYSQNLRAPKAGGYGRSVARNQTVEDGNTPNGGPKSDIDKAAESNIAFSQNQSLQNDRRGRSGEWGNQQRYGITEGTALGMGVANRLLQEPSTTPTMPSQAYAPNGISTNTMEINPNRLKNRNYYGSNNYSLQIENYTNGRRQAEPQLEVRAGEIISTLEGERSLLRARLANNAELILGPKSKVTLFRPTAVQLQVGEMELIVPEGDQIDLYGPSTEPQVNFDVQKIDSVSNGLEAKPDSYAARPLIQYSPRGVKVRFRTPPQIVTGRKVFRIENQQAIVVSPLPQWVLDFHADPNNSESNTLLNRQLPLSQSPVATELQSTEPANAASPAEVKSTAP